MKVEEPLFDLIDPDLNLDIKNEDAFEAVKEMADRILLNPK